MAGYGLRSAQKNQGYTLQTKTSISTRGLHWKNSIILQILNRFNSSIDASMIILFLVLFTFKWFYK
jgi:hypothetical protein